MTDSALVSHRYWQLADLSRTVDDGLFLFERERLNLLEADRRPDVTRLRRQVRQVVCVMLVQLTGTRDEVAFADPTLHEVTVPSSIVDALRRHLADDEEELIKTLRELTDALAAIPSLTGAQVSVLNQIAKTADIEASASLRLLMRK
jgi:hypothetical protein